MVFHRGRPVAAEQGVLRASQLRDMIESLLPRSRARSARSSWRRDEEARRWPSTRGTPRSYGRARIPGAAHIPIEEIEGRLAELHIAAGGRSSTARGEQTKEMAEQARGSRACRGFLEGGFLAWEAEGLAGGAAGLS